MVVDRIYAGTARRCGATSLHDGLIYVVGGLNVSGAATSTLYVYDPATNRSSQKASAPVPLNKPNVVGSGGRLYVLGSRNRPRAAYRYDPVANIWSAFAAPPGGRTGFITGIGGSGRIYAIGGSLSGEAAYDPVSKTWSAEGSPLADKTVAVTNQYDQVDAISYDPVANTFALLPQSIAPIQDGSALSLGPDSRVYQLGGECVCDPSDMRLFSIAATQVFNPNTKLWGVAQFAPFDAIESATAVWGGKLYEFGGESTDSGSSSAIANAAAFTPGDVTPPTGTPPRPTSWGTGLINGAAPIVVSWPATDASGISWYDTSYRVNGGAWQFPGDFANQDSSHEFSIGYGQSYQWMAAATDNYGNRGLSVTGPAFTVRKYEESASLLRYTGVWHADTTSPLALIAMAAGCCMRVPPGQAYASPSPARPSPSPLPRRSTPGWGRCGCTSTARFARPSTRTETPPRERIRIRAIRLTAARSCMAKPGHRRDPHHQPGGCGHARTAARQRGRVPRAIATASLACRLTRRRPPARAAGWGCRARPDPPRRRSRPRWE